MTRRPASPRSIPMTGRQEPVSAQEGGLIYGAVYSPGLPPPAFEPPVGIRPAVAGGRVDQRRRLDGRLDGPGHLPAGADALRRSPADPSTASRCGGASATGRKRPHDGSPEARTPPIPPARPAARRTLVESTSLSDPCQGPFRTEAPGIWIGGTGDPVPQLSADGSTVAFLAGAPPIAGNFGEDVLNRNSDLYVVDMAEGLTRSAGAASADRARRRQRPGTRHHRADRRPRDLARRWPGRLYDPAHGLPARLARVRQRSGRDSRAWSNCSTSIWPTTRSRASRTALTGGAGEATHGTEVSGQDPYSSSDGALSPSFSDRRRHPGVLLDRREPRLWRRQHAQAAQAARCSTAATRSSVSRVLFGSTPTPQYVSSAPASPPLTPAWRLGVSAFSRANGSVLLEIQAPGAGTLRAGAQSAVRVKRQEPIARQARPRPTVAGASVTVADRTVATRSSARRRRWADRGDAEARQALQRARRRARRRALRDGGRDVRRPRPPGAARERRGDVHAQRATATRPPSAARRTWPFSRRSPRMSLRPRRTSPRTSPRRTSRRTSPRTSLLAAAMTAMLLAGPLSAPAGAEGLADDGNASWRLEQPAPPEPPAGVPGSATPIGLGRDRRHRVLGAQPRPADHGRQRQHDPAGPVVLRRRRRQPGLARAGDGVRGNRRTHRLGGPGRILDVSDGRPGQAAEANGTTPPLEDDTLCHFARRPGRDLLCVAGVSGELLSADARSRLHRARRTAGSPAIRCPNRRSARFSCTGTAAR